MYSTNARWLVSTRIFALCHTIEVLQHKMKEKLLTRNSKLKCLREYWERNILQLMRAGDEELTMFANIMLAIDKKVKNEVLKKYLEMC